MGGCRCSFRSCKVNTLNFPKMHFFHYPLKFEEVMKKWVKYADFPAIYDLSQAQAKNKVVCALHFRDESFMNYRKDRLIPRAYPTIVRLRNGLVLDYSLSDNPKPMALPPTTEKHLIPPAGYNALGLPEDYFMNSTANVEVLDEEEEEEVIEPVAKIRKTTKIAQSPTILNKGLRSRSISLVNGHQKIEISTITLNVGTFEDDEYGLVLPDAGKDELSSNTLSTTMPVNTTGQILNIDEIDFMPAEREEEECIENENLNSTSLFDEAGDSTEMDVNSEKMESENNKDEAEAKVTQLEAELADEKEKTQQALARAEEAELYAKDLEKKLKAAEAANQILSKTAAVPKQKPSGSTTGLTKPQLFNGIKKYLSASMTALVRMEMFGESERQWKADEKQASVELLRLGGKVYNHFRDEWRCRLPPRKEVEEWLHEVAEEDEEDL